MSKVFWRPVVALLTGIFVFVQMPAAFAGTTGSISGVLTDASGKAIAGATVSAASPSQTAKVTTDASGHYSFISLTPDTYVLAFEKGGFQPGAQRGVTVQADNNVNINFQLTPTSTATIGRTSTSASTLVRAGQTSSVYYISPSVATAAASLGGGTNLTSAYSAIGAVPGVQTGTSNTGVTQSVEIRGGNYDETGFEFDGVPINRAFDQYNNSSLPLLGTTQTQVYTGNSPAGSQANGSAGFVNQVVKVGTYPGYFNASETFSTPGINNGFMGEFGVATKNGNIKLYVGTAGQDQVVNLANQWNGRGFLAANGYGTIYNVIAQNCGTANASAGCYNNTGVIPNNYNIPFAPNGFAEADTAWGASTDTYQRQDIANLVIGIPHPHDGLSDTFQALWDYNLVVSGKVNSNMDAWGSSLADVVNGTAYNGTVPNGGGCPGADFGGTTPVAGAVACLPAVALTYVDFNRYQGPIQAPFTAADVNASKNYAFPYSPSGIGLGAPVPNGVSDSNTNELAITKFQYQHNISTVGYLRAFFYSIYSGWINPGPVGPFQDIAYDGSQYDYTVASHTRGGVLDFGYQLNSSNFLTVTAGYTYANTIRYNDFSAAGITSPVAYLVNSLNPGGGCYSGTGVLVSCTGAAAAEYRIAAPNTLVGSCGQALCPRANGSPVVGTESAITCGTGPCEYYAVSDGTVGPLNSVTPKFFNASISDQFKPTPQLTIDASLRSDTYSYLVQGSNTIGNLLMVNSYNAQHCISGTSIVSTVGGVYGGPCPAGYTPTTLSANSPNATYANILQPRVGISFQVDPLDVLKASYGRFVQAPPTYTIQGSTPATSYYQATTPSTSFYADFGANSETRTITQPEISYNLDFSWAHQFHGTDLSFQVTPFLRKTQNEIINIPVDPTNPNFITGVNGAGLTAQGIEFAFNKGDFSRNGWAASLAFTYTSATSKYYTFPSTGGSLLTSANQAIVTYNQYTSFCAANPTDSRCHTAGVPAGTVNGAACYLGGTGVACGTPGAVANPYWNLPPQGLLDPNASYQAYNGYLAQAESGGTSSGYITPFVTTLLAQYKHNALRISPSLQIYSGGRYGTPFSTPGVAPDTCGALGNLATSDPRYTNTTGQAGASGYDAQTCTGNIYIPNPKTGFFDSIGGFTNPTMAVINLQAAYDITKQFTVTLIASNLFSSCFGGTTEPWSMAGRNGCAYAANGFGAGNFYNPGNAFEPGFQYSYAPILGYSGQAYPQGSVSPTQLTIQFTYHGL